MSEYPAGGYVGTTGVSAASGDIEEPSLKDKAVQSADAGKQAVSEVAQTAMGDARDVLGEGKAQARNLVGEARDQLRDHAGEQQRNAVTNLRSLGDELRSMANGSDREGVASELVAQAADRTHGAADWLDGREPEDLLEELRRLARRRPGAFLLGALAAGVVAGRLTRGAVAVHSADETGPDSQSLAARSQDRVSELSAAAGIYGEGAELGTAPRGRGTV
jgi:hypothetical protein